MQPNSNERREVAERMRLYSHDFDFGNSNPFYYVEKAAFGNVDRHPYCSVFTRLADIIDPTCKIESVEPIRYGEIDETIMDVYKLTCGHCVVRQCGDTPPAYCDECGCRVVNDDD